MSTSNLILLNQSMPPKKPLPVGPALRERGLVATDFTPLPDSDQRKAATGCNVRYRVDELLQGGREAILVHRGQEYRLRITSAGKLILTK